ncbi:sporulation-specific diadenylate cyclase CdaS [Priestia flexa]|uniref:Diadenylate cyclase n=2 Tax=Bacteria TaxID=2 RepID=A0ABU4JAB5_9BACI|nr:sporulation-specific diadenylate cyclase CdaS [Priestia flexa]MDW8517924.1 sporulation-specific diadenylate cyclase CdaS [Priestia flexa]QCS51215.1 hypothetical protein FED53_00450 [Priestia flexa]
MLKNKELKNMNCDFSPMKQQLSKEIHHITNGLQQSLEVLGDENYCVLGDFKELKRNFIQMESVAASFYLNCYLSSFTDKYEDLSFSVQQLSNRRHGALIVVERQDSLDSLIQKGTALGANLTAMLLETIFYPGNPLHDGAVLIRANQIVSAANVLPLTTTVISEEKLGTRHRAALGLTEKSDALVLVVSEETGRISFALNGKLYPITTPQSLH